MTRHVIPAEPGYNLIRCWGLEADAVEKLPIIAWVIKPSDDEFATVPVTTDGVARGDYGVLQPDGRVIRGGNASYKDYSSWLRSEHERLRDEQERELKKVREYAGG